MFLRYQTGVQMYSAIETFLLAGVEPKKATAVVLVMGIIQNKGCPVMAMCASSARLLGRKPRKLPLVPKPKTCGSDELLEAIFRKHAAEHQYASVAELPTCMNGFHVTREDAILETIADREGFLALRCTALLENGIHVKTDVDSLCLLQPKLQTRDLLQMRRGRNHARIALENYLVS